MSYLKHFTETKDSPNSSQFVTTRMHPEPISQITALDVILVKTGQHKSKWPWFGYKTCLNTVFQVINFQNNNVNIKWSHYHNKVTQLLHNSCA
jgi:hypothetical protein